MDQDNYMSPFIDIGYLEQDVDRSVVYIANTGRPSLDMGQGVLGERICMNRKVIPIPRHHVMAAKILIAISGLGILPFSYGVWQFSIWPTLFGGLLMYVGKLWYFDRMVWLYKDMKDKVAEEEGAVPKQLTIK